MKDRDAHLDRIFYALSDKTRREILRLVARGPRTVSELAGPFDMSLAAISKHIQVMESAGLINKARSGRVRRCSIDFDSLEEASGVIDEYGKFWSAQLSSLDDYLQDAGEISPKEAVMETPVLMIRKKIRARRESVYNAWTNPGVMAKWFYAGEDWSARVEANPRVGGSYRVDMLTKTGNVFSHTGTYLEVRPPERLSFTWNSPTVKDTTVVLEFIDLGEETEIVLTHRFLPTEKDRHDHNDGWMGCLTHLEQLLGV
jgi:uncharacterized protein YndB with AHSA1/START domain/DNA-binding transcriptional ArsR family regulator